MGPHGGLLVVFLRQTPAPFCQHLARKKTQRQNNQRGARGHEDVSCKHDASTFLGLHPQYRTRVGQNVIGKTRAGKPLVRATKIWAEARRSASAHGHTKPEGLVLLAVAARLARGGAIVLRWLRVLVLVGLLAMLLAALGLLLLLGVRGGAVALTDGLLAHLFVGARLLFQLRIAVFVIAVLAGVAGLLILLSVAVASGLLAHLFATARLLVLLGIVAAGLVANLLALVGLLILLRVVPLWVRRVGLLGCVAIGHDGFLLIRLWCFSCPDPCPPQVKPVGTW